MLTLQVAVAVAAASAGLLAALHRDCAALVVNDVLRGLVAGAMYGGVKTLSRLARPQPCRCLADCRAFALIVWKHELAAGFLGGWMVGTAVGVWHFFTC
jgi:hypothetical protein